MTLYIGNPKGTTIKLIELINKFSKVPVYKLHVQKSVTFLHTINKISEN